MYAVLYNKDKGGKAITLISECGVYLALRFSVQQWII